MQNLLGSNSKYRFSYWIIWATVATGYAVILMFFWDINWQSAWSDAMVFSALSAIMGIAVWYVVKFSTLDSASVFNTLITHLVAGAVLVFLMVTGGEAILNIFPGNTVGILL